MSHNAEKTIQFKNRYSGRGAEAVEDVILDFERANNRSVTVSNDPDLRLNVKTDILKQVPPDVWVDWCGKNIKLYVESNGVSRVSELWHESGFFDVYYENSALHVEVVA
jgi:hypothetical protein